MEKYLVIILLILLMFAVYQCWNLGLITTEGFAEVPTNVDTATSITTLAQVAVDLQAGGGLKVPGNLNVLGGASVTGRLDILSPDGKQNTHLPFSDGKNYIRGPTQQDGDLTVNGKQVVNGDTSSSNTTITGRLNILSPDGKQNTHLPFSDGKNYIRGPTQQDGDLTVNGNQLVNGGIYVKGRDILTELDKLRADLDDRTRVVMHRYQGAIPKGYKTNGQISGNGHAQWAEL